MNRLVFSIVDRSEHILIRSAPGIVQLNILKQNPFICCESDNTYSESLRISHWSDRKNIDKHLK